MPQHTSKASNVPAECGICDRSPLECAKVGRIRPPHLGLIFGPATIFKLSSLSRNLAFDSDGDLKSQSSLNRTAAQGTKSRLDAIRITSAAQPASSTSGPLSNAILSQKTAEVSRGSDIRIFISRLPPPLPLYLAFLVRCGFVGYL